ncbi:MAG: hypothetical protein AAFX06_24595 [Planctomycetota bacterium]
MQVVHTAGVPPNQGKTHLLMIGWTWKTKKAPRSVVAANQIIERERAATGCADCAEVGVLLADMNELRGVGVETLATHLARKGRENLARH